MSKDLIVVKCGKILKYMHVKLIDRDLSKEEVDEDDYVSEFKELNIDLSNTIEILDISSTCVPY